MYKRIKTKKVCGVGINDADYRTQHWEKQVNGTRKLIWICPAYKTWKSMIRRCYDTKFQQRQPRYIGCEVCDEWKTFTNFKKWFDVQERLDSYELDKDFLIKGNKTYAPEKCIFISKEMNRLLNDSAASETGLPVGVHFNKKLKKYMAHCNNPFKSDKQVYLGLFSSVDEAKNAWKMEKRAAALAYSEIVSDERLVKILQEMF